jgi:hypothetical protein
MGTRQSSPGSCRIFRCELNMKTEYDTPPDKKPEAPKGWIGVDLDATLAVYEGWNEDGSVGEPIPLVVENVKRLLAEGCEVRIVTARACRWRADHAHPDGVPSLNIAQVEIIEAWCEKHLGKKLPVVFWKDENMIELWDDRAVQFFPNEGMPMNHILTRLASIATKMYQWAQSHGGAIPPEGWEELRVLLKIPPPQEQNRIIKSTILPKSPVGHKIG